MNRQLEHFVPTRFTASALAPSSAQRAITTLVTAVATRLIASALAPVLPLALSPAPLQRENLVNEGDVSGSGGARFMQEGFGNVIMSAISALVLRILRGRMRDKSDAINRVGTAVAAGMLRIRGGTGDKSDALKRVGTKVGTTPFASVQSPTNPTIIEIRNLKKSYGLKPVLRGIDLELCQGERMALLGANGAGKTTLLRILAGLTKPDAGMVTIAGLDCVSDAQQIRQLVGFVGHQPYLYEELTVLENLLFFGRMYTVKHARERALYLLQRVGLEKRIQERVSTLSRGQVQRLAWARALLHSPHLLLLDEPDTGLDQEGSELIDTLLAEHSTQGGSIVFTTHQLERALQLSERVVVLGNRRVAFQEATQSLDLAELQRVYREVGR